MNALSRGRVSLRSSDPAEPPNLELGYLRHPYDRRVLIEAAKVARRFIYESDLPLEEQLLGPASESEEDVLVSLPLWHLR
jgi:hypothetical protein